MDRVRVIRVLEYEGPRDWIETCLAVRGVKGTKDCGEGRIIREAIVGDFPVVVEQIKETYVLTEKEAKFMPRFGWDFSTTPAIKYELQTSRILAHEGDETWDRDLRVAGE